MARIACFESISDSTVRLPADTPHGLASDGSPLQVRYDMDELKRTAHRDHPARYATETLDATGIWRYRDVLPSGSDVRPLARVTLGEGWTPMLQSRRFPGLLIKQEGANPTGTSKARGLALTVTLARHYGIEHLAIASAGGTAPALAAYAAAAGIAAHIFIPSDAPVANYLEAELYGADLHRVDGAVLDCARLLGERIRQQREAHTPAAETWFDISGLTETFGLEGEKTMGYELVEQLGWRYPEAVLYPADGGLGLLGIWKAFEEMEALGWIEKGSDGSFPRRPGMYAIHSPGRAPDGRISGQQGTVSDAITLSPVTRSGGRSVLVDDPDILQSILDWARHEGILLSREGAAVASAYTQLLASRDLHPADRVVLVNTGAGFRDADLITPPGHLKPSGAKPRLPTSHPVGGIITPV